MITIRPASETSDAPVSNASSIAQEPDSATSPIKTDTGKKPMPLVWLPTTLGVGLLIAGVYLGARILNAHHTPAHVAKESAVSRPVEAKPIEAKPLPAAPVQATPSVAQVAPAVPPANVHKDEPVQPQPAVPVKAVKSEAPKLAKSETPKPAKAPERQPATGESVPMIAPQGGQRYIQVGALDLERTRRYIGHLRDAKLEPHVAPGPTPEMLRILIGPFADRDSLSSVKSQLDRAGIDNFVREY